VPRVEPAGRHGRRAGRVKRRVSTMSTAYRIVRVWREGGALKGERPPRGRAVLVGASGARGRVVADATGCTSALLMRRPYVLLVCCVWRGGGYGWRAWSMDSGGAPPCSHTHSSGSVAECKPSQLSVKQSRAKGAVKNTEASSVKRNGTERFGQHESGCVGVSTHVGLVSLSQNEKQSAQWKTQKSANTRLRSPDSHAEVASSAHTRYTRVCATTYIGPPPRTCVMGVSKECVSRPRGLCARARLSLSSARELSRRGPRT